MAKNIVIFSDGTGQERGKTFDSNIVKLLNLSINDAAKGQITAYDAGLGAEGRKLVQMSTGFGIKKNIYDCYEAIVRNYQPGDRLFFFGFSRGAYTVRALAGWMKYVGILPEWGDECLRNEAWKVYQIKDQEKRIQAGEDFRKYHGCHEADIEFMGVFDTVKALGLPLGLDFINPYQHKFFDHSLSGNVKRGYHAISLDDNRLTFHPEVWDEKKENKDQVIEQVWFAGVHSDIGGSYEHRGLGDITLTWMLHHAKEAGLLIDDRADVPFSYEVNPNGHLHNSQKGWSMIYRNRTRLWSFPKLVPQVYQSVVDRDLSQSNRRSAYRPWIVKKHETITVPYVPGVKPVKPD